jgi:hypothetical protein
MSNISISVEPPLDELLMTQPKVVMPISNRALRYIKPDLGKVEWDKSAPTLQQVRGSVYEMSGYHVIPSLDPDVLFDSKNAKGEQVPGNRMYEVRIQSDWNKAGRFIRGEASVDQFEHRTSPTLANLRGFRCAVEASDKKGFLTLDIETWGDRIRCVGFSLDGQTSFVVPTEEFYWQGNLADVWSEIGAICDASIPKAGQNLAYDAWWLEKHHGIRLRNFRWDTMWLAHVLDSQDNRSLDYLASLHLHTQYWKDEAKEAEEILKYAKTGLERLYVYNGLDVLITHRLVPKLAAMVAERGQMGYYRDHYVAGWRPLLDLSLTGVRMDPLWRPVIQSPGLWVCHVSILRQHDQSVCWLVISKELRRTNSKETGQPSQPREFLTPYWDNTWSAHP